MKTVKDLGALVKVQYPQYAQYDDEVVGKLVKTRYPGAYKEFIDVFDNPFDQLPDQYKAKDGRIKSWWKGGQSEKRGEHLENLADERDQMIRMFEQDQKPAEIQRNHEVVLLEASLREAQIAYDREMLEQARAKNIDLETYKKVRFEQEMANIRIEEKQKLEKIALKSLSDEYDLDQKNADRVDLTPALQATKLRSQLNGLIMELFTVQNNKAMSDFERDEKLKAINLEKQVVEKQLQNLVR